ncbi:MAG: extensin family protein [Pseudomonadota bacterium]
MIERWLWRAGAIVFIGLIAVLVDRFAPQQHLPWKPLDLSAPIGWGTGAKLDAMSSRPETCFGVLDAGGVTYQRIADTEGRDPCGFYSVLYLQRSHTPYSTPIRTTCSLAAALNVWERQILQPAAERHFGQKVDRINTFGTFSCRRINNASSGPWSEHAGANAIDISGFRLEDGSTIQVVEDWRANDPKGAFLEDVFAGACRLFRVGLGPDYNAAHADHFHFDMGPGFTCR